MADTSPVFASRGNLDAIERGTSFQPKFDRDGLIVAIAVDAGTGEVLMVAHMNAEALARTIATGEGWFFSRSRQSLWKKGEASGNVLAVKEIRVDCDQDAIVLKVTIAGDGVACHTGYRSCFYRSLPVGTKPREAALTFDKTMRRSGDGGHTG